MASSSISFCHMNVQQHRKPFPIELRRPKLLKDFLNDNSNSCSSSGFDSFPRHQPIPFKTPKIASKTKSPKPPPPPSSSSTISAFQAVINAVKNIPFTTVKSPSFLPRSLSRRLSRRDSKTRSKKQENDVKIPVKVKDILRWTSFRDLVEEISPPLDFTTLPHHYTTTTTTSIDSSFNSSNGSSWCESDFTAEILPSWSGNSGEKEPEMDKTAFNCVGMDSVEATTETANYTAGDPQDGEILLCEEDDQQSPVSVFNFQFRENEEHFSTFDQSLASVERTRQKLILEIKRFESLANLEPLNSEEWTDEMRALKSHDSKYDEYNWEMVSLARAWLSGEQKAALGWGFEANRDFYIKEMHKEGKWSQFEVEQEELALEIEAGMLGQLIVEVLDDLSVN
ncbi:hypothetical protein PanWU01x14_010940 [Parasponia andersonii]|uniref:Uncharacterized protein n=1 Tax=Parasponia andersonii TaxID=3476 RepID=A0A2P5E1D0_PARAD|nr:hypothetical protein PanWU01x14_010940 [Parasponia andersonii]